MLDCARVEKETPYMNLSVLEIAEFRATKDAEALHEAARLMEPWLRAQPGFKWRRLAALGDGVWLDCLEWADMASAKAVADQIMTAEPAAGFMAMIDGPSVVIRHASVAVMY
jgi:hypothetical protein